MQQIQQSRWDILNGCFNLCNLSDSPNCKSSCYSMADSAPIVPNYYIPRVQPYEQVYDRLLDDTVYIDTPFDDEFMYKCVKKSKNNGKLEVDYMSPECSYHLTKNVKGASKGSCSTRLQWKLDTAFDYGQISRKEYRAINEYCGR